MKLLVAELEPQNLEVEGLRLRYLLQTQHNAVEVPASFET